MEAFRCELVSEINDARAGSDSPCQVCLLVKCGERSDLIGEIDCVTRGAAG